MPDNKYDDIINRERPASKRPKMAQADRAKIFMPFAALRGYDRAVESMDMEHEYEMQRDLLHEEIESVYVEVGQIYED